MRIIILVFICNNLFAQNNILLEKYYSVSSVIFDKGYKEPVVLKDKIERITLTSFDIESIEQVLETSLPQRLHKYYRCNGRQYIGYINTEMDKKAVVAILNNYRNPDKFLDFNTEFLVGFGSYYEDIKNQNILIINLTKNTIE